MTLEMTGHNPQPPKACFAITSPPLGMAEALLLHQKRDKGQARMLLLAHWGQLMHEPTASWVCFPQTKGEPSIPVVPATQVPSQCLSLPSSVCLWVSQASTFSMCLHKCLEFVLLAITRLALGQLVVPA